MIDFNCGLYTITAPSGRLYIGSAINLRDRWSKHLCDLRADKHHCAPLQRAFTKYGEAALQFAKIAFVPREDLLQREQEQIDAYPRRKLLNTCFIAGSRLGDRATPEALANMSRAKFAQTPETRAKISAAHKALGTRPSREAIERGVAVRLAKGVSEETRAKLSIAGKRRAMPEFAKAKIRATKANRKTAANRSGVPGVHQGEYGRWIARYHDGVSRKYLGSFDTKEAAAAAIAAARAAKDK